MTARYRLTATTASGKVDVSLDEGEHVLGREPGVDILVDSPDVSRRHARFLVTGDTVQVEDLSSTNGTFVNGDRVVTSQVHGGDRIRVGDTTLELLESDSSRQSPTMIAVAADGTAIRVPVPADPHLTRLEPVAHEPTKEGAAQANIVGEDILRSPIISEAQLREHGIDVAVTTFVGAGGGMGSFVWADLLRVSGVPAEQIAIIGTEPVPYARYQRLCRNSQIPPHERLRSNSDSCPDNAWGFPSYASREMWRSLRAANLRSVGRVAWQIFGEPALTQTYTPRSGDVFESLDREAARIGWLQMLKFGRVRAIRKSVEGRLVVIASASTDDARRHVAVAANIAHLALGYPAIQLLPDLAAYREKHGDRTKVVNAYEEHPHIYEQLRKRGGTVVLRGRGIVASRIIQRLYEERQNNPKITIVHLHRSRLTKGHTYGRSRRGVENEFEFQPFNWPKGCWTGEQRATLERASPHERARLLDAWGGTTTADRRDWRRIVREGVREGWYRPEYGVVEDLQPTADGKVSSTIAASQAGGGKIQLIADFVIDCTGLIASPDRSIVLDDLVKTYQLPLNELGRLQVTDDFEVASLRDGSMRLFANGATTLGGPHAAVDSFLGLQYAAFRSVEAARQGFPDGIRKLNGWYSWSQWWRWMRGANP